MVYASQIVDERIKKLRSSKITSNIMSLLSLLLEN